MACLWGSLITCTGQGMEQAETAKDDPGPDAGARQATQIADANHESNIKICVLDEVQQNTSNAIDFSTSQMKAGMDCDRVRRHQ